MLTLLLALLVPSAHAVEGMWLPEQAPEVAADLPGLALPPEALADPLGDPLGSIVTLGFCSASFVSPDGLVATNHHCVEGFLQYLSTADENLHQDGFLAPTRADERWAGPSAKLRVVEAITDVTREMTRGIGRSTRDAVRADRLEANEKRLVAACEATPDRRCYVAPYFGGSTWRLIRTFEIEDVRLAWAPAMSLGQFGGEIDNWMWPRHAADAAFLRPYVAPDGSAAPFSEDNVPYRPPHHLTVSTEGVDAGDLVMIAGFPGRTERHLLARELRFEAEQGLPYYLELATAVRGVLQRHIEADPEAAARLGATESRWANGFKNTQGMLAGLTRNDLFGPKERDEAAVLAWAAGEGRSGADVRAAYDELQRTVREEQADQLRLRPLGELLWVSTLLPIAHDALRHADERRLPDARREPGFQARDLENRRARYERAQQSLYLPAERELMALALGRYVAAPGEQRIASVDAWVAAQGGVDAAVERLFDDPALATVEGRLALLEQDAATLRASDDPWLGLAEALEDHLGPRREARKDVEGRLQRLRAAWMDAKRRWADEQGAPLYDDANSTLRLTFGTVQGYTPQDGLRALPFTTLAGLTAKAGPAPFDAPADVLARVPEGPSSRWADPALGDVPVNFLSDLDITGGNSGSAILDGEGRLVGLAFDGNWESIASDWLYLADVNRCIGVDMRYVLWLLDGEPRAARLLTELGAGD